MIIDYFITIKRTNNSCQERTRMRDICNMKETNNLFKIDNGHSGGVLNLYSLPL